MPTRRITYVDQPFAMPRQTPDTSRLAALYTGMGHDSAALALQRGAITERMFQQLAGLFSGFQQQNRENAATTAASARRDRERLEDRQFTASESALARTERADERKDAAATRTSERAADAKTRADERAEAAVAESIDKAPRGIVDMTGNRALYDAAQRFPNQAARFVKQDGVNVLPMTGVERQAYDRELSAQADRAADNARQEKLAANTIRHDHATEATTAAVADDKTVLTPGGLDIAALNYRKTGVMPPLGNGDKSTRQRIINRAAEMTPADMSRIENVADIAGAKQEYVANMESLKNIQKSRDTIAAFEKTASKNIDVFLTTAGKVVDTGSPLANRALRFASGEILGSPDVAAYNAARQVAVNEIAKIVAGGGLNTVLSDSARQEISHFNPANATLAQTVATLRLLKQDMANRAQALDAEIETVKQRGKTTVAPTGGTIEYDMSGRPIKKP